MFMKRAFATWFDFCGDNFSFFGSAMGESDFFSRIKRTKNFFGAIAEIHYSCFH